jgi:RNA polymerase sigma-70 factor (ECF subfamily)
MDVTQDSFVALAQQLGRVQGDSEAFALVYSIATNQAIDRLRRNTRWSGATAHGGEDEAIDEAPCEAGVRRIEAAMELALLTRGESPRALTAALLHFVEGCTLTEVGEALELSPKTAGRLLERFTARARKRSVRFGGERK